MTRGKRRDIRTAIRLKHGEPFKLRAFIVALQVPPLFHRPPPPAAFPLSVRSSFPRADLPFSRRPLFPALGLPTALFEPYRTVYKVALLNWKPQLCRCYCHPFFLSLSFLSSPLSPGGPLLDSRSAAAPAARSPVRTDRC